MYPYATLERAGISVLTFTHNGCLCNEILALQFRHQMSTPPVSHGALPLLRQALDRLLEMRRPDGMPLERVTLRTRQQVVNSYKGRHRIKYFRAMVELNTRSLNRTDFYNRGFVKPDKEQESDLTKAGRLIQFMRPTGALEMGRFTHAVEMQVYSLQDGYDTKIFGKGGNLHDIAEDLNNKREHFHDPIFLLLDASKFDAHVSAELLRLVAEWYPSLLTHPTEQNYVKWMWSHTYTNYGSTQNGLRYRTHGTRMSGHMDTGLGNSLIMYAMLTAYMATKQITKYSMSVNGDDSVIVIERADLTAAKDISFLKDCGFNMKFEHTDNFSHMDYCQTRPVKTKYGWVLARSPERMLRRIGWSSNLFGARRGRDFLYSLGKGEKAINYGLPIGYALGQKLLDAAPNGRLLPLDRKKYISYTRQRYWATGREAVIDRETRESFAEAWGMSPEEQELVERSLRVSLAKEVPDSIKLEYESVLLSALLFK